MIPVIVTAFDVTVVLGATPVCAVKLNVSGVVSVNCAPHDAFVPPFAPLQDQLQGPTPVMGDAEPLAQRFIVGATVKIPLFELPQLPFTGVAATVVDVNAPDTPPTVSVVVTDVPLAVELVCRTQTLWLSLIVAAALVNVAVHPIE